MHPPAGDDFDVSLDIDCAEGDTGCTNERYGVILLASVSINSLRGDCESPWYGDRSVGHQLLLPPPPPAAGPSARPVQRPGPQLDALNLYFSIPPPPPQSPCFLLQHKCGTNSGWSMCALVRSSGVVLEVCVNVEKGRRRRRRRREDES